MYDLFVRQLQQTLQDVSQVTEEFTPRKSRLSDGASLASGLVIENYV